MLNMFQMHSQKDPHYVTLSLGINQVIFYFSFKVLHCAFLVIAEVILNRNIIHANRDFYSLPSNLLSNTLIDSNKQQNVKIYFQNCCWSHCQQHLFICKASPGKRERVLPPKQQNPLNGETLTWTSTSSKEFLLPSF